jgi:hypothetical protein
MEEMRAWTWHHEKNARSGTRPRKFPQATITDAMKAFDRQHDLDAS